MASPFPAHPNESPPSPPYPLRSHPKQHSRQKQYRFELPPDLAPATSPEYSFVTHNVVKTTSLFTSPSPSSSLECLVTGPQSPKSEESLTSGVRLPTVMSISLPPTPPLQEPIVRPRTPERQNTSDTGASIGDASVNTVDTSPITARGLRRMRGSISEGSGHTPRRLSNSSEVFEDGGMQRRRLSLHHPKQLRRSPKSIYMEEERKLARLSYGTSPTVSVERVPESAPLKTMGLNGSTYEKERIMDKSGRKVTPWATPQVGSVATSQASSPGEVEVAHDMTGSSGSSSPVESVPEITTRRPPEIIQLQLKSPQKQPEKPRQVQSTKHTTRRIHRKPISDPPHPVAAARHPVQDAENIKFPSKQSAADSTIRSAPQPNPLACYSPKPTDLLPAINLPIHADQESPDKTIKSTPNKLTRRATDASDRSKLRSNAPIPPLRRSSTKKQKRTPILIYQPPEPSTPSKQLPAMNLIPATPNIFSPTTEASKQLGVPPPGRPRSPPSTGIGAVNTARPIPEDEVAPGLVSLEGADGGDIGSTGQRPKLEEVMEPKVRESKLHPWWQPKVWRDMEEEEVERERQQGLRRRDTTKEGRKRVNIGGTKLVVEFVTWKGVKGMLGKAGKGVLWGGIDARPKSSGQGQGQESKQKQKALMQGARLKRSFTT